MDIDKFYNVVRIVWLVLLIIVGLLAVYGEDIIEYQETAKRVQQGPLNPGEIVYMLSVAPSGWSILLSDWDIKNKNSYDSWFLI